MKQFPTLPPPPQGSFDDIRMDESEKRIVTDEIRKFRDAYDKVGSLTGDQQKTENRTGPPYNSLG